MTNATIENYNNVYNQNSDFFLISLHKFREKMCDKRSTFEEIEEQLFSLTQDYFRCEDKNKQNATLFEAVCLEWQMRQKYLLLKRD